MNGNEKEYVEAKGLCCLFCGADCMALDSEHPMGLLGTMTVRVRCLDCGGRWDEVYTLTGVKRAKKGGE